LAKFYYFLRDEIDAGCGTCRRRFQGSCRIYSGLTAIVLR